MKPPSKKGSKNPKARPRRAVVKTSLAEQAQTIAELRQELAQSLQRENSTGKELREALEQQTATSEILRVIASSPTDLQPVMNVLAENAARLCEGTDAVIFRIEGDSLQCVANYGPMPVVEMQRPIIRGSPGGRAVVDRQTIHVHDIAAEVEAEFPEYKHIQGRTGTRTVLATPLLREGVPIGVIFIRRTEVRPFTNKQIALLKTFADQAVIAIENARLFQEQQARNRELAALHDVTTTANQSLELKPVLDQVVKRISEIFKFDSATIFLFDQKAQSLNLHASFGFRDDTNQPRAFRRGQGLTGRAAETGQPIIFENVKTDPRYQKLSLSKSTRDLDYSFFALFPIKAKGKFAGTINCLGKLPRKLSSEEIRLITSMSEQVGVAVENINLYEDLKGKTEELESSNSQLREALEQQTATSEILGVIASSPTDIQPVLDTVAENAARLCEATDAAIMRVNGDTFWLVASHGPNPILRADEGRPITRGRHVGRAIIDRETIHIRDLSSPEAQAEYSETRAAAHAGIRTVLVTPLLREGVAIGAILIQRKEVCPFTEKQIKLLETFGDQAVIAIENVRLFKELQERNRDLTEALEQQTATGEVLRVIASSPTEIQPVLDTVIANAVRLIGAEHGHIRQYDGEFLQGVAYCNVEAEEVIALREMPLRPGRDTAPGRAFLERKPIHVPNVELWELTPPPYRAGTILAVPMLREGTPIGTFSVWRKNVMPFTERQIELVTTFADQAVIAIENVRLFNELKESLEQQTATSEILGVIASSPTDIQPVLNTVAVNAARLCDARDAQIRLVEGDGTRLVASFGTAPAPAFIASNTRNPAGRAILQRQTIHIHDLRTAVETEFPENADIISRTGTRTFLSTPMLREGTPIGLINIRRTEVRPFSDKQIKLLETFADQAVIALENVRLFQELKESLEQQTATSEILGVIASSPTDVQPVLNVVAENAARLCEANDAQISRVQGDLFGTVASFGPLPPTHEKRPLTRTFPPGRAIIDRETIHIPDLEAVRETEFPDARGGRRPGLAPMVLRTVLATPLLREGIPIGAILIRRLEVRPFTDKQISLLKTFAAQAVIAIENVRLFQELEARTSELARSVGELKALGEVGQAVSSTLDLQTVLSTIVRHAVQLSGTSGGVIYEYNEAAEELHLHASYRMEEELVEAYRVTPLRIGQGATGRSAATKAPVQVVSLLNEPELGAVRIRPILGRLGYQSLLAVPLLLEQRIMGALTVYRRETGSFAPEVVNLLQTFATQSALAIQNARLYREIEDKSRQIEAANRHKSEFLANMSHELRTPLNAIIGFSEVLGERMFGELNEKQAEYTEDILSSGRHLLSLINEILDLSKVEAGRMELELATFDLPLAIDNARTFVRERATKHGINLDVTVDERLGDFVGDERKIKQVLLNLLSNAVKFTPEGGRIGINARQADGSVEISVSDTGIGIAPEDQPKIFEEFRQVGADYAHKVEGTGLGLTLAKKFVELHGGRIWVDKRGRQGLYLQF